MDIEETAAVCAALRSEADALQKKQRRKGIEYRFKEPMKRPLITGELAGAEASDQTTPSPGLGSNIKLDSESVLAGGSILGGGKTTSSMSRNAASAAAVEKNSLSSGPSLMSAKGAAAAAQATRNKAAAAHEAASAQAAAAGGKPKPSVMDLADYDPKAVAAKEHDVLLQQVTDLREESSNLRHQVEVAKATYEDLRMTLVQLSHEDDIELEQQEGVQMMEEEMTRTKSIENQLRDADAYQKTLTFMLARYQKDKLTNLAALRAFEDAIRVHKHELDLQENLLRSINKSRDAEVAELQKSKVEVTKQLSALDTKLESRRVEVKTRQEKARRKLQKIQVRTRDRKRSRTSRD